MFYYSPLLTPVNSLNIFKNALFINKWFSKQLFQILGIRLIPHEARVFFTNLINDSIKLREEGKITQTDMMQLLLETKKKYDANREKENTKGNVIIIFLYGLIGN